MNDSHRKVYEEYRQKINRILSESVSSHTPDELYDPLRHILESGGKRIRPMMVLFCCEASCGNAEPAMNAAAAIELLHNFTLVHDDIMDNADTRRGLPTIHTKWNTNVAILSGDLLIGVAYKYLLKSDSPGIREISQVFTEGIIEVCEGQSYDKEFEDRTDVTPGEYLMMIGKKTAKMLETSAAIGALFGGANTETVNALKSYALNLGIAFQIQDDLLDISSDENTFGKKIGGDLVEGKKTYMLLKAAEIVKEGGDGELIRGLIAGGGIGVHDEKRILEVKEIFGKYGVIASAQKEIAHFNSLAEGFLSVLKDGIYKDRLKWFSEMLLERHY